MIKKCAFCLLLLLTIYACTGSNIQGHSDGEALSVSVSILPQAYFIERIGGAHVAVNVMVGPGDEPHSYEPTPSQMRMLAQSKIYFSIGVEFEKAWMLRFLAVNPDLRVVDTAAKIERLPMAAKHDGDMAGEPDPHIWLSPALVKVQAQNIYDALVDVDPAHTADYKAGLDSFLSDIDQLDASIRGTFATIKINKFMSFHPAWGYFAHDYGLEMIPIEIGGQEPSAEELARTIDLARQYDIRFIFTQKEFSNKSAEAIAGEIGAQVVLVDPLARDWLSNMQTLANAFASALGQ
ncbi:MAG: zinc ABC transporter substrate-binding protein [Chloroflexota bacterium]